MDKESFVTHGISSIYNTYYPYLEISRDCSYARLKSYHDNNPKVTKWKEIRFCKENSFIKYCGKRYYLSDFLRMKV